MMKHRINFLVFTFLLYLVLWAFVTDGFSDYAHVGESLRRKDGLRYLYVIGVGGALLGIRKAWYSLTKDKETREKMKSEEDDYDQRTSGWNGLVDIGLIFVVISFLFLISRILSGQWPWATWN
jgi:hypothetical protein